MKGLRTGCSLAVVAGLAACAGGDGPEGASAFVAGITEVADVGFLTPESVVHDPIDDVYLVSNINGGPSERNEQGFISRLSPDGEILELRWIDGLHPDIRLHAPKGMALRGDSLFVADINCLRIFHRATGAQADSRCFDDITFMNAIAIGPEGSLFLTDSGLEVGPDGNLQPSGTDAVYRMIVEDEQRGSTLIRGEELGHPNGIAVGNRGIFVVTFGTGEIFRLTPAGEKTTLLPPRGQQLDGIVFLPDGGFAYSSWTDAAVFLVDGQGAIHTLAEGLDAPADIGFDENRNRILVPLFNENKVVFIDLE